MGDTYITTEIYADDLSVVLPNSIESVEEAIKTIKNFENYSGLAINLEKSTLSVIGHNHDMIHPEIEDKTIKWTKTLKILGISSAPIFLCHSAAVRMGKSSINPIRIQYDGFFSTRNQCQGDDFPTEPHCFIIIMLFI